MSNIKSTKRNGAVFLAAVLVAGIFFATSPSFIIGVNAQSDPQYGMDTIHSSYEPEPEDRDNSYESGYPKSPDQTYNSYGDEYSSEYKDKEFNSYEPDTYGMDNDRKSYVNDNSYEPTTTSYGNDNSYDNNKSYETNSYEPTTTTTSYGMDDNNYQKTYGKADSYDKSQYQSSYTSDYKPEYQPYGGKDDSYKFIKDSSSKKSVSLNKLNCINNNVNINGNNAGNISIGNKGQAAYAEEGYSGAYSSGGYGSEGYSKQDKGFECLINNNNINNNFGAGNATDGNVTEPCEECFAVLNEIQINSFLTLINAISIEDLCERLAAQSNDDAETLSLINTLRQVGLGLTQQQIGAIIECLIDTGVIDRPTEETLCFDGIDNDGDGSIDFSDPDCSP